MIRNAYLVASGDLRLAANQQCWPAQAQMEAQLGAALPSSPAAPVEPAPVPQPGAALGGLQLLARFLGLKPRG